MLDENRIKLMTRMASYEEGEGKKNSSIARHFRSDYVGLQVLKAVICATIASMIVFGVYIFCNYESLLEDIYKIDLWDFAAGILKKYVVFTVSYSVVVYITFSIKYNKAKKSLKKYFNNLKLLNSIYVKEAEEERFNERTFDN